MPVVAVGSTDDRGADGANRLAASIATALFALLVAMIVASVPLQAATRKFSASHVLPQLLVILPFGLVGATVARRQPRNAIGWILLAAGIFFSAQDDGSLYTVLDYRDHGGRLPVGPLAVLVQPSWAPAIVCMVLALLLFPDARLPLGLWRWILLPFLGVAAVWMIGAFGIAVSAILDHTVTITPSGDLTQLNHPTGSAAWWGVVQNVFFPVLFATGFATIGRQIGSYRHSTGDRRLQLKWLLAGAAVFSISGFVTVAFSNDPSRVLRAVGSVGTAGLAALPICIGVAILKYRLFEIDRLVSRTLSYAIVTGLLVGLYVGLIALTTRALSLSSPVAVAASTLAAAALFAPLRRRIQRVVDRRFNRARFDSEQTVAAFSASLRDDVDLDRVQRELLEVVQQSMQPGHLSLWLSRESMTAS